MYVVTLLPVYHNLRNLIWSKTSVQLVSTVWSSSVSSYFVNYRSSFTSDSQFCHVMNFINMEQFVYWNVQYFISSKNDALYFNSKIYIILWSSAVKWYAKNYNSQHAVTHLCILLPEFIKSTNKVQTSVFTTWKALHKKIYIASKKNGDIDHLKHVLQIVESDKSGHTT